MKVELYWTGKLLGKKKDTAGHLILVVLVLIPLVVSLVFVDSMIEGITQKFICLSGGQIQFQALKDIEITDPRMSKATSGYAEAYTQEATASALLKGVEDDYFNAQRLAQISVEKASDTLENGAVMMSRNLARKLGLNLGDKFALMVLSNPDAASSKNYKPVFRPVMASLGAVYSSGYDQLDDKLIFGSFDFFSKVFKSPTIQIEMLTSTNSPEENMEIASRMLEENPKLLSYVLWNEMNLDIYENFVNSRQLVTVIVLVIAFIACFYCGTIAHEIIEDNFSQICIMRLLGISDAQVKKTVFFSVSLITTCAIIIGFGLGILLSYNLAPLLKVLSSSGFSGFAMYLLDFKIDLNFSRLALMVLILLGASLLSVFVSIRKEKKSSPLMLLRS